MAIANLDVSVTSYECNLLCTAIENAIWESQLRLQFSELNSDRILTVILTTIKLINSPANVYHLFWYGAPIRFPIIDSGGVATDRLP